MKIHIRILVALGGVLLLLGGLGSIKGLQIGRMVANSNTFVPPPQTVTVAPVEQVQWENTLRAVGSLEAVQGVMVAAELGGKVTRIAFEPGAYATAGDLLIQQDVAEEIARLRAAKSEALLARKNLDRARVLAQQNVVSEADLDAREANYEQAVAQVDTIHALIDKKTIRAPFSGRLGIRRVNQGEVLEPGQPIVSLQALDPIFVNFQLPQQSLADLKTGYNVRALVGSDTADVADGTITALNPEVDRVSRNITIQATLDNADERMRPGMFASVEVVLPEKRSVLTIPATAVLYAPYSDSVFIVESKKDGSGGGQPVLRQQFVRLGEQRGDHIAVLEGLGVGQSVVSTGVFKLRNGMAVEVDNTLAPDFELNPNPDNA